VTTPPLLTPDEVAAWLRVPIASLATRRYRGEGPPFLKVGRLVRYRVDDVEGWLNNQQELALR